MKKTDADRLSRIRQRIDALDADIHQLLIARSAVIDQLIEIKGTSAPGAAFRPDREAEMTYAQLWQRVHELPEKQRDAVLLVYGEELSHAQAAKVMGCAESTVSSHIHEAKRQLKGLLVG